MDSVFINEEQLYNIHSEWHYDCNNTLLYRVVHTGIGK